MKQTRVWAWPLPLVGSLLLLSTNAAYGLYANKSAFWVGTPVFINVCWTNASTGDIVKSGYTVSEATARGWVRSAIESNWQRYARVNFRGWGNCPASGFSGIRMDVRQTGGSQAEPGSYHNRNRTDPWMHLNLYHNDPGDDCDDSQANLETCARSIALHEFGHALGFYHEEERPDYVGGTGACAKTSFPNSKPQYYGGYDLGSVMSYCGQAGLANWKTNLSLGDIAAVQRAYGRRVSGQMVSKNGDCLADNPGNGNIAFIWDCDEASGQKWLRNAVKESLYIAGPACLDLPAGSDENGTLLQVWSCLANSNQEWVFENVYIRGWGALCLDLQNGDTTNGTPVNVWQCGALGGANQKWSITGDGTIRYGSLSSGKCLTAGWLTGESFRIWTCDGAADQKFTLGNDGSITVSHNGTKCMDQQAWLDGDYLKGAGLPANGQRVQTFDCRSGQRNQKWNFSGPIELSANRNKCVDLHNSSTTNGTPIQIWDCNNSDNQKWDYYFRR